MKAKTARARRPAKARKPVKRFTAGNVFDQIQQSLHRAEEEVTRTPRFTRRGVQEWS
jgi:hypothetical protein